MTTTEWAENEIKLARKRAGKYGDSCLRSALKAYKSLSRDGHSGWSWNVTRNILETLLHGKPLSPITEQDFDGEEGDSIQCKRMFSLFKNTSNGKVTYTDIDRAAHTDDGGKTWYTSGTSGLIDTLFPITLPYTPTRDPYKIYVIEDVLYPGTVLLLHIDHILTPEYDKIEVDSYWVRKNGGDFVRCDKEEFERLKNEQGETK